MIRRLLRRVARRILRRGSPAQPQDAARPTPPPTQPVQEEAPEPEVEVDGETVASWVKDGRDVVFVDIREPHEVAGGHVAGATLVPMNQVPDKIKAIPTDKPVVIYCAAGGRSFGVTHYLREQGIADTWSLIGGIGAWIEQDADAWAPPPSSARFKPTRPVRLSAAGAKRLGRDVVSGTIQQVGEAEGAHRYTLGILDDTGMERITDLSEDDLEPIGRG